MYYRKGLALQVGHVHDLYALHGIQYVLGVGRELGDALLEVEHLLGKLSGLEARSAQQLNGVFQEHFVRVDCLVRTTKINRQSNRGSLFSTKQSKSAQTHFVRKASFGIKDKRQTDSAASSELRHTIINRQ